MRCAASVSQNQSAVSSVSARKRAWSFWACFRSSICRRASRYMTRYTTPPEKATSSRRSSTRRLARVVAHRRRDLEHFVDGGEAGADLHRARDAQRLHAVLERLLAQHGEI